MTVETNKQGPQAPAPTLSDLLLSEPPPRRRTAAEKLGILTRLTLQLAAIDLDEGVEHGNA